MKKTALYIVWAVLYCLCVGLGFVENPTGAGKVGLVALGVLFFAPPFYLVFWAKKEQSRKTLLALRLVSIAVLSLSLILLVLNFLSVNMSSQAGLTLYVLLVMFSAPMVCIQHWFLGLFLWASLLMVTLQGKCPCQK